MRIFLTISFSFPTLNQPFFFMESEPVGLALISAVRKRVKISVLQSCGIQKVSSPFSMSLTRVVLHAGSSMPTKMRRLIDRSGIGGGSMELNVIQRAPHNCSLQAIMSLPSVVQLPTSLLAVPPTEKTSITRRWSPAREPLPTSCHSPSNPKSLLGQPPSRSCTLRCPDLTVEKREATGMG